MVDKETQCFVVYLWQLLHKVRNSRNPIIIIRYLYKEKEHLAKNKILENGSYTYLLH